MKKCIITQVTLIQKFILPIYFGCTYLLVCYIDILGTMNLFGSMVQDVWDDDTATQIEAVG